MIISTNGHKAAVGKAEHAVMAAATPACIAGIRACQNTPAGEPGASPVRATSMSSSLFAMLY